MSDKKFGPHSISEAEIFEDLGSNARQVASVIRTAQGRYYRSVNPFAAQGQTVLDVSSLKAKVVLQEVFGLERAMPGLSILTTPKPMNQLIASFYVATQSSAHRKVAKGQEADVNMQKYLKVDMELWLNAGHVAQFREDQLQSDVPIYSISKEDAAGSLSAAKNLDIADEIVNATEISGADWGGANDPRVDIAKAISALTAGGSANANVKAAPRFVAMHPDVWLDFITNTKIETPTQAGLLRVPAPGQTGAVSIPMYPDLQILIDGDLLNTSAFVIDPRYFLIGQGPMQSFGYANDMKRLDGFVLYEYTQPKLVMDQNNTISIGVRELTGVHA